MNDDKYSPNFDGQMFFILIVLAFCIFTSVRSGASLERKPITNPDEFTENCLVDDVGWVSSPSDIKSALQRLYNETGVQGYVVIQSQSDIPTGMDKDDYIKQYFKDAGYSDCSFVLMYFTTPRQAEEYTGVQFYVGKTAQSVLDISIVEYFTSRFEDYWFSKCQFDDVIIQTLDEMTEATMHPKKHITRNVLGIFLLVIIAILALITSKVIDHKAEKIDREAEKERILNTSLEDLANEEYNKRNC